MKKHIWQEFRETATCACVYQSSRLIRSARFWEESLVSLRVASRNSKDQAHLRTTDRYTTDARSFSTGHGNFSLKQTVQGTDDHS